MVTSSNLLAIQNPWWLDVSAIERDQHLLEIENRSYRFVPAILDDISFLPGDIHIIRGPRQVGKTTAIKLVIKKLLSKGTPPDAITYISCETFESFKELQSMLIDRLKEKREHVYLFLDEVSFVHSWQRALLGVSNMGLLKNAAVVLTGSNARDLKESGERLPGRRGKGRDLKLYPLGLPELMMLPCFAGKTPMEMLDIYMLVGGFPHAIADLVEYGAVMDSTYETYRNWIVGDAQRYELRQETLKQILYRVSETLSSRVTWPVLIENSPIKSHETALHYVEHLQDAFLCKVNHCYDPEKHGPAFNKARKLYFNDPLLYAVAMTWRDGIPNIYEYMKEKLKDPVFKGKLFESVVINHLSRSSENVNFWYSTKQHKEVDVLIPDGEKMKLFEVKSQVEAPLEALGQEVDIIYPESFLKMICS